MAAAGPQALDLSCPELAAELKAAVEPLTGSSEYLLAPNHRSTENMIIMWPVSGL